MGRQSEPLYMMERFIDFIRVLNQFHEKADRGITPLELEEILLFAGDGF